MTQKGRKRLHGREILSVKKDKEDNLWVVTNQGLGKITLLDHMGLRNYNVEFYPELVKSQGSRGGEMISDIAFDQQGNAYVSTFEGSLVRSKSSCVRGSWPYRIYKPHQARR